MQSTQWTNPLRRATAVAVLALIPAVQAAAQSNPSPNANRWARATSIGVYTGAASNAGDTRIAVGGTAAWDLSRWCAVEARGDWFDRTAGAQAFGATINALVNLVPRQTVTPFAAAGFGLHHTSFDTSRAVMPGFYQHRLANSSNAVAPAVQTFTDTAFYFATGVDLLASRHLALRPEVGVVVVRGGGQTDTVGTFGVRVAYRFERHLITPTR